MKLMGIIVCGLTMSGCVLSGGRTSVSQCLSGDIDALHEMVVSEGDVSLAVDERLARHDLWVYLGALNGCTAAAVRLEQRSYSLVRHGLSPKDEFRRELDAIHPSVDEEADGLGLCVRYLRSVLDGDMRLAENLRMDLKRFGIKSLSKSEEEFLACKDNKVLLPYAQGVSVAWNEDGRPGEVNAKVFFYVPSCRYKAWSKGSDSSTRLPLSVELAYSSTVKQIDPELVLDAEKEGRFLVVIERKNRNLDAVALRASFIRLLKRYDVCIGSDIKVFGDAVEAGDIDGIVGHVMLALRSVD